MPTLAHLAQQPRPDWSEGGILPPFAQDLSAEPSVFSFDTKTNPQNEALVVGTAAIIKNEYKLILYFDHDEREFEFYNLKNDPEELNDRYSPNDQTAAALRKELIDKIDEANRPFLKQP